MNSLLHNIYADRDTYNIYASVTVVFNLNAFLRKYIMYPLIAINILGNILNIIIFSSKPFQRTSIGFLFVLLSIAELFSTYTIIYSYIIDTQNVVFNESDSHLLLYFYMVNQFITPAISVLVPVDRCISVMYPKLMLKLKLKRNQILVFIGLLAVFFLINIAIFFQNSLGTSLLFTSFSTMYQTHYSRYIFPYMILVFAGTLPFVIMCLTNIITVFKLNQSKRRTKLRSKNNDNKRFLIITITLNILFLVFYLPRFIIELIRIRYFDSYLTSGVNDFVTNLYLATFYDYLAITADFWKYLYSTIQFIFYIGTNKIYRRQFLDRIVNPYKKPFIIGLTIIATVASLGFLIFYLSTIGKLGSKQFCISSKQCQENMKCENSKCICEYYTMYYSNNTCKVPSNNSLNRDFRDLVKYSKPEILIDQLPGYIIETTYASFTSVTIVERNGTFLHYVFEASKASFFVFDRNWVFKSMIKLKIPVYGSTQMIIVENYAYFTSHGIFKCDLDGNVLKGYENYTGPYVFIYHNVTDNKLYVQNNQINLDYFEIFDLDLNKMNNSFSLNIYGSIKMLIQNRGKILIGTFKTSNYSSIYIHENKMIKKEYRVKTSINAISIDDYDNILYSDMKSNINFINKNGKIIEQFWPTKEQYVQFIGFDIRKKIIIVQDTKLRVFN